MKITLHFEEHESDLITEIMALEKVYREKKDVEFKALVKSLDPQRPGYSPGEGSIVVELPQIPELLPVEGISGEPIIIEPAVDLRQMFGEVPTVVPPLPPPPAAIPSTSLAPHVVAIPADLDRDGMPWDGRIHSSTKAKVADGTWRAKRGVDKDLVTKVTAEYKQLMAIPVNGDTRTLPLPLPPVPSFTGTVTQPVSASLPPVPSFTGNVTRPVSTAIPLGPTAVVSAEHQHLVPQATVAPPVASSVPINSVGELVVAITGRIAANTLKPEQVTAACVKFGIPAIPLLGTRPDLIPLVVAELGL